MSRLRARRPRIGGPPPGRATLRRSRSKASPSRPTGAGASRRTIPRRCKGSSARRSAGPRGGPEEILVHPGEAGEVVNVVVQVRHLDHRLAAEPAAQQGEVLAVALGQPALVLPGAHHLVRQGLAKQLLDLGRYAGVVSRHAPVYPVGHNAGEREPRVEETMVEVAGLLDGIAPG